MVHNKREISTQGGCELAHFVKVLGHHVCPLLVKGLAILGLTTPLRPSTANPRYSRVHKGIVRTQPFHFRRDGGLPICSMGMHWEANRNALGRQQEGVQGRYRSAALLDQTLNR